LALWLDVVRDKFIATLRKFSLVVDGKKGFRWGSGHLVAFASGLTLTKLEVDFGAGLYSSLNNESLCDLGRARPLLEILYLPCSRTLGTRVMRPKVTLKGLLSFLSGCPNMDILEIVITASDIDSQIDDLDLAASELRLLSLDWSPIRGPHKVAEVFNTFLPLLENFDWKEDTEEKEREKGWKIVWNSHQNIGLDGSDDGASDASFHSYEEVLQRCTGPMTRSRLSLIDSDLMDQLELSLRDGD
jgi:hypothetical protein